MAEFLENGVLLWLPKEGEIRTTESELNFYSDVVGEWIKVPTGLKTDLGSIPAALQWLFPTDGKAVLGYVLHDYLYKTGLYTRNECDDILEEAMKLLDVSYWKRRSVRAGLKVGGWVAWNNHR